MKKLSVVLLALVMAFAWTASAFADATPYASIRMQTFYLDVDNAGATADTSNLLFNLYPTNTTRLGVKFKVSDEVSGLFEISSQVALRHAFGTYKFGAGELLIGQTWAPYTVFFKDIYEDTAGLRYGSGALRAPQVRMTFTPGVYVALIKSALNNTDADDVEFPELAIGYKGKAGSIGFGIHGTYVGAEIGGNDIDSYAIMADINAKLGPADVMARAFYGQDVNNLLNGSFNLTGGSTSGENNSYGVLASVTFYPSDKVAVTLGGAYVETEATGDDDNAMVIYANAPIKVTKGFTIVPEIAYEDALDVAGLRSSGTGAAADSALWIGAKWQFDL
jgi:hypothetical protein